MVLPRGSPSLVLGTLAQGFPLFSQKVQLNAQQLATHKVIIGIAGSGKTGLIKSIVLQLLNQGIGCSFIDPHGDASVEIIQFLLARGFYKDPQAHQRLRYIEFSEDEHGSFFPMNVLNQPEVPAHTISADVLDSMHRAWPALAGGAAPMFDTLTLLGTKVLVENHLCLPAMGRFLTDKRFREGLLATVSDPDIVAYFHDNFDALKPAEATQQIQSTIRRLVLLTFNPVLKFSLGQPDNYLSTRQIMDSSTCVIYNLSGVQDQEARGLLGCLISSAYERAAMSRRDVEASQRPQHHLIIDEWGQFAQTSEQAINRMLSETRKYGLFVTMAHQTLSQTSARSQSALQNARVKIVLKVGREDAEVLAKELGVVDPMRIKSEPASLTGQPIFYELTGQWEEWTSALVDQKPRAAWVKIADQPTVQMKTLTVDEPKVDPDKLAEVLATYQRLYLRTRAEAQAAIAQMDPERKDSPSPPTEDESEDLSPFQ